MLLSSRRIVLGLGWLVLAAAGVQADERVYQKTLLGTVWVITPLGYDRANTGSGALVDLAKKWVVTNYHVVEEHGEVVVCFPALENGEVVGQRDFYAKNMGRLGIRGKVIARDARRDLALIALESLPGEAKVLPMAAKSVTPGQNIHSIGNPALSPALWVYTSGTVRQVAPDKWQAGGNGKTYNFDAWVILAQNAVNPGDSGGPVVNDKGELVGLVSSTGAGQLNNKCIDIREIKGLLTHAAANPSGTSSKQLAPAINHRDSDPRINSVRPGAEEERDQSLRPGNRIRPDSTPQSQEEMRRSNLRPALE